MVLAEWSFYKKFYKKLERLLFTQVAYDVCGSQLTQEDTLLLVLTRDNAANITRPQVHM